MITIALCEDNQIQRDIVSDYLEDYRLKRPEVTFEAFASGEDLLAHIRQHGCFDIYILDIVMPNINGMELATTLRMMGDTGKMIFITSSIDYAVASYEVNAFYYMMKPVEPFKLNKILDNALETLKSHDETIEIKTKNGEVRLKINDIMYVEIKDRAVHYCTRDGRSCESLKLRGSFKESVTTLSERPNFAFCGVSRLINLKYVDVVDSESVLLNDGTLIYYPHSAWAEFRKAWKDFGKN